MKSDRCLSCTKYIEDCLCPTSENQRDIANMTPAEIETIFAHLNDKCNTYVDFYVKAQKELDECHSTVRSLSKEIAELDTQRELLVKQLADFSAAEEMKLNTATNNIYDLDAPEGSEEFRKGFAAAINTIIDKIVDVKHLIFWTKGKERK